MRFALSGGSSALAIARAQRRGSAARDAAHTPKPRAMATYLVYLTGPQATFGKRVSRQKIPVTPNA
eukprot:2611244-Prymnesium_polylepis.3